MPTRRLRRTVTVAVASASLAVSLLPSAASAQAGPMVLAGCTAANFGGSGSDPDAGSEAGPATPEVPRGTRCGTLPVPLDHSGATAGRVSLNLAVVPATGTRRGTLAVLTGGPGEPAVPAAAGLSELLEDVREGYDLVLVDQRGSGGSDAVPCRSIATATGVRRCAAALGPRRPFLTTKETALDLEDVRAALGAERLSLLGISYGAKVAGEYARRFPARTERIVLDSPAPVDGLDTSLQLRQLGLPRVLKEVCAVECAAFISDPSLALRTLVRRLERRPLLGRVELASGRSRAARVTVDDLYALIVLSDLDPILRTALPAAVASGVLGDAAPLLRLVAGAAGASEDVEGAIDQGRLLATSCLEGRLPWAPDSPVEGRERALAAAFAAAPAQTFAPFSRETVASASLAAICSVWPSTPTPEPVANQGPDAPVLVLAGREDLRTPLEDARRTAAQYPNATVLAVPGAGHSVLSSDLSQCAVTGVTAFLAGAAPARCRRRVELPLASFIPASAGDLQPLRGTTGAAGRTATAVALTLDDLARAVLSSAPTGGEIARVPGLRGGSVRVRRGAIVLTEYEVVRGVGISGTVRSAGTRLAIRGPGGVTGVLTRRGLRYSGVIGGQRVSFVLR